MKTLSISRFRDRNLNYILAISSFHFSTLEEYYCGGLYLGVGNGVTDGSAGIIAMFIYLGMFGNAWTLNIAFGTWTYA